MNFEDYDEIVGEIYAAAQEPARWPEVVRRIAIGCESPRALLFTPLHSVDQGGFGYAFNMPEDRMAYWEARGMHEDILMDAMVGKGWLVSGKVMTGDQLVPRSRLLQSRFYQELWRPTGILQVCAGIIFDGRDMFLPPVALSIYRGPSDPDFAEADLDRVRRLVVHLARALSLTFHLRDLSFRVAASTAALERLAVGVVLLDMEGCIQFSNHAARRLFCRASHVVLNGVPGERGSVLTLQPVFARQAREFQAVIQNVLRPGAEDLRSMQLTNDTGAAVCVVHAAPLCGASELLGLGPRRGGVVFLYDLEEAASIPAERLIRLYGLTPAEAGLALEVVRGGSSESMAGRLGISVNTVNTHLRRIFDKTATHRQADLLKLLLALSMA
ncbi:MAG: hypothetical protein J0L85_04400 [Zoogloea sp.]|nr:hypothetical protein [Zoogloea sp.]MCA0185590.1 LuxR C-terminal-related transcriptional regulator [Pseudomonadota bacterium]